MFRFYLTIIFFASGSVIYAQSQAAMNDEAYKSFKKSDSTLLSVFQKILIEYRTDTLFINNLQISQSQWQNYRDSELALKFPDYGEGYYGTSHSSCVSKYLEDLTIERIDKLRVWLIGIKEGDMCSGSVKMK